MNNIIERYTHEGITYEIENDSFTDEYGRLVSDYVPYKIEKGIRERLSPETYALSRGEAEQYVPRLEVVCPTCKHITYNPLTRIQ